MAKLQRTFLQGKMNKDLDERLIPNGQYRDAQNIQVSTSEGSDVGAVENMLGNVLKNDNGGQPWDDTFDLTNPVCIGVVKDSQNEKIYWFLTSSASNVDAIMEFDQTTGVVSPVLVDTRSSALTRVLNFSSSYLITGINILNGLLIWTDNLNEPRIINIATFKAGSSQGGSSLSVTTQVYGRDFKDTDITVIKLKPNTQPVVTMDSSLRSGFGSGLNVAFLTRNFTEQVPSGSGNWKPLEIGDSVTLTGINDGTGGSPQPVVNWVANDIVILTAQRVNTQNFDDTYEIRLKITSGGFSPTGIIEGIALDLPFGDYLWSCVLEEADPMFEFSFPRFAYRWKYVDNEYSAFSPWTEPAFLAGVYDYDSANVFNKAMRNNLRKLTLNSFETAPKGVAEIDILYKDSASAVVYKVDSIPNTSTTFAITSELIYNVINSDQLIRPYDNVPKKAQAQEIIGNRIVYGNYTQNYDVPDNSQITIAANSINNPSVNSPLSSLKSLRTYQVGIVYLDEYGRETPVFTNDTATIILPKSVSTKRNRLSVTSAHTKPAWNPTHFKYYVKDISNEYYNFVLDRFYDGGDGTVWLSIPSAERNKVATDDFIILKKEHNNSTPVEDAARYKIIDISNEVPQSVANQKTQLSFSQISNGIATVGSFQVTFTGPSVIENPLFSTYFKGGNYIRIQISTPDGMPFSNYYEIESGGLSANTTGSYKIILTTPLGQDIGASIGANFNIYVYENEQIAKPEYQGKFFAKINRDTVFDNSVIYTFTSDPSYYNVESTIAISATSANDPSIGNEFQGPMGWSWNEYSGNTNAIVGGVAQMVTAASGETTFGFGFTRWYPTPVGNLADLDEWNTITTNSFIQLQDSDGDWGQALKITAVSKGEVLRAPTNAAIPAPSPNAGDFQYIYYVNVTVENPLGPNYGDGTNSIPLGAKLLSRKRGVPIEFDSETVVLTSPNPAIFETEPSESVDLDLYYEATAALPIADLNNPQLLNYFNCYSFGNGVESNRVEDDFNAKVIGKGVKVSSTLENVYEEERRGAGLIYSGIFNGTGGVNELNQFIAGLKITKDLNPSYGTIQKLHARDTDLITLMEDKCFRVLADKDALFNADGNSNVTSNNNVLGQTIPFVGEYGISKNPESFASFGFRSYFVDKARGTVMRLSRDGLTDLGAKQMSYFFQNALKTNVNPAIVGAYDSDVGSYNVVLGGEGLSFKEQSDGWNTRMSYDPEFGVSLNNEYYTFKNGEIWEHSNLVRSNFYGTQYNSTVTPIFNDAPTSIKNFKTLSYEGDAGWTASITTNEQSGEVNTWKKREGIYFNYIIGDGTFFLADLDGDVTNSNTIVIAVPNTNISVGDTVTGAGISGIVTVSSIAADKITIGVTGSPQTLADEAELTFTKVADIDTSDFSVMGIGNVLRHDSPYSVIIVDGEINVSLQPGDIILTDDPGKALKVVGTVLSINRTTNTITLTAASPFVLSTAPAAFILFAKNTEANTSGLLGYYGEVVLTTASSDKKELFAVNSEIFISSE